MSLTVPNHEDYCKDRESVVISLEESSGSSTSSPTFKTSGLVCPSNLGALLESTTATLVSKPWKDGYRTVEDTEEPMAVSEKDKDPECQYISSQQYVL